FRRDRCAQRRRRFDVDRRCASTVDRLSLGSGVPRRTKNRQTVDRRRDRRNVVLARFRRHLVAPRLAIAKRRNVGNRWYCDGGRCSRKSRDSQWLAHGRKDRETFALATPTVPHNGARLAPPTVNGTCRVLSMGPATATNGDL